MSAASAESLIKRFISVACFDKPKRAITLILQLLVSYYRKMFGPTKSFIETVTFLRTVCLGTNFIYVCVFIWKERERLCESGIVYFVITVTHIFKQKVVYIRKKLFFTENVLFLLSYRRFLNSL